jgi:hypothetical protein
MSLDSVTNGGLTMSISLEQFEAATKRGENLRREYAASSAYYDRQTGRVVISFPTDLQVSFLPQKVQGLQDATPTDLNVVELSPSGLSLHFPAVDADVYIPALMHNVLGGTAWMSQVGRIGGAVRSERKAAAARENGKHGGRPSRKKS